MTAISALPSSEPPIYARLRTWVLAACGVWILLALLPFLPPLAPNRWPAAPRLSVIIVVALAQTALLLTASRRRVLGLRVRQSIMLLAAGMFLVAVSDTLVVLLRLPTDGHAFQGVNDFLELAYNLLGIAALLWLPLAPRRRNGHWLVALDIAVAVGGMTIVLFITTTLTGASAASPEVRSRIFQYGLITAANLVALNLILVRGLARPVSLAVSFLAATVVIEIVYWVIVQLKLGGLIADSRPLDMVFAVDQVCYALAGLSFLTARVEPGYAPLTPGWMLELNPLPAVAIVAVGGMTTERVLSGATAGVAPGVIGLVALSLLMVVRVMLASRDRSHLVRLELETEQRLHADRVLAIRRLAGGIAHEFNNLMAVVIGTADMEITEVPRNVPARRALQDIRDAGQRAADLTARLLTYAGQSSAPRETLSMGELLRAMDLRVRAAAGDRATVHFDLAPAVGDVRIERRLIEQSVLHLVRNARSAMPDGGDVYIRLSRKRVAGDELAGAILPAPAGTYAVLEVRDSGCGIPPLEMQRIFDPFYTSASPAVAAGLGLAVVHGAVALHGGGIAVESAPGAGTAIRLYLPLEQPPRPET
ncbi:MAG: nitrogen regulation protein NR(II) [Gemmatimonadales bacterium]